MRFLMYLKRHYRVPSSYDLTTIQLLGQNLSNFLVGILVQTMTPKGHFEINWPLSAPLGFSDLPTALKSITTQVCKAASARDNDYGEN